MSHPKPTRRTFGLLISSVLFFPRLGLTQSVSTSGRDGGSWSTTNQSMKYGYVVGFIDATTWAYGNVEGALYVLKSLSSKDRELLASGKDVWNYGNIEYSQLIEGMDSFYGDYRNKAIKWDRALSYVRDTIRGEPQEYLDRELEFERKAALLDSEKK